MWFKTNDKNRLSQIIYAFLCSIHVLIRYCNPNKKICYQLAQFNRRPMFHPIHVNTLVQGGAPQVVWMLVYNPMKTVDISPTKTLVIGVINQLNAIERGHHLVMIVFWVYPHDVHQPPTVQHQTQWFHWHVIQYDFATLAAWRDKRAQPSFNQQEWGVLPAKIGFQPKKMGS